MTAEPDYDVAVIGAGGAGLAAAASAAGRGRSVLVIEAAGKVGGSTALAGGSFMAAGTSVQEAAGFPGDTPEAFYDHYLTFNRWAVDPAVAHRFCFAATPTLDWLTELGVTFTPGGLYRATLESAPRSHRPVGGGQAIVDALVRHVNERGVDIALGRRVDSLEAGAEPSVFRIRAGEDEVTACAVVLATGGFGSNAELVRKYLPDADEDAWSPAAETCRGDGIGLAGAFGAEMAGLNHSDVLMAPGLVKEIEPFPPGWLLIVGADGRRFVSESAPYAVVTPLALEHGPCWVILDDPTVRSAKPQAGAAWGSGSWTADTLLAGVEAGRVLTAATLEDLAESAGLPASAVAATVRRYNSYVESGEDREFFKAAENLRAVSTSPFYAVRLRPQVVAVTAYGIRIDAEARVLGDADSEPIPGLFAAGEVTGNVLGPQYLGGGNAIGSALIFGKIAGESAADYAAATGS